jgi:hypothetical protein
VRVDDLMKREHARGLGCEYAAVGLGDDLSERDVADGEIGIAEDERAGKRAELASAAAARTA